MLRARQFSTAVAEAIISPLKTLSRDHCSNIPASIEQKIGRNLHCQPGHPLYQLAQRISRQFPTFSHITDLSPVVTVKQNFDDLLVAADHVSRSPNDTYFVNQSEVLRTHTSAHQSELLRKGLSRFLVTADVYRRDEINATHYPIFHQMEGVCVVPAAQSADLLAEIRDADQLGDIVESLGADNPLQTIHDREAVNNVAKHLRHSLESMVRNVFPAAERPLEIRWIETQFPFTSPSWEMEIYYRERWLEICGCGVIRQEILDRAGRPGKIGWAFGVGLERLAMVLHDIPDIRLFWSQDPRFLSQFDVAQNSDVDDDNNKPVKFRSFSKYPATYKDVSFWVPVQFHENIFCEMVREVCGDWVEDVQLIDKFTNRKTGRESRCYRIMYRAMDRTLLNEEVNQVQDKLLDKITTDLGVQIR